MGTRRWDRREIVRALGRAAGGALAAPLAGPLAWAWAGTAASATGCAARAPERLLVVPPPVIGTPITTGLQPLGLGGERDGVRFVPPRAAGRAPLVLLLHGAGGSGRRAARLLLTSAERAGCVVLAPDSRGRTWDAVGGEFGPDPRFIERGLADTFARCPIDPTRVAVAGFSDGATYALGLGRANGGLFTHVMGFSPGFLLPAHLTGDPLVFVSHGRSDDVLPIDACSRILVPELRRAGYQVRYREFDGGHELPPPVAQEAIDWFLGQPR